MLNRKIEHLSEPILLKARLWRLANRVLLETAMPPVFGKESLLTAIAGHLLLRCFSIYWWHRLAEIRTGEKNNLLLIRYIYTFRPVG
jgi:hypothetical protein